MRAFLTAVLGSLLFFALPQASPAQERPPQRREPPRVRLSLLSQLDALSPGDDFLVGLRYKLTPHWHVYWKNPGDSGRATEATLAAPEGFEVGPLLFPGPQRIVAPGDVINFGYEDEVVLFWRVTAPEDFGDATEFRFEAQSEWLVCKEECERGDGKASLALPLATAERPGRDDLEAFGASLQRLPKSYASLEGTGARWEGSADEPVLVQELAGTPRASFFPETEHGLELQRTTVERGEDLSVLRRWYSFRPTEKHPQPRVRGLLAVERDDTTDFYELDLTRPRAAEKETR
jgi:DsbC/DsbD-like thiol-disulfide interchange protein